MAVYSRYLIGITKIDRCPMRMSRSGGESRIQVDLGLSPIYLRDFADRCRRMARWEANPRFRTMLLRKADDYERQAVGSRNA